MKTSTKIALLLGGLAPFPFAILMFAGIFYLIQDDPRNVMLFFNEHLLAVMIFNLFFTLFFGAVHIIYIILAARNPNLEAMRVTWIVALVILGALAMPFYWYYHIWRDDAPRPATGRLGLE
jgi:hypothetical protein